MGTFSTSVSKQANAQGAAYASQTQILVAGSTTVHPASVILANDYMYPHPRHQDHRSGRRIGRRYVRSRSGYRRHRFPSSAVTTAQMTSYPNLKTFQIGARSVVWIVNSGSDAVAANKSDIQNLMIGNSVGTDLDKVQAHPALRCIRTRSTAAKWVGIPHYWRKCIRQHSGQHRFIQRQCRVLLRSRQLRPVPNRVRRPRLRLHQHWCSSDPCNECKSSPSEGFNWNLLL